jgi:hypothetical protein
MRFGVDGLAGWTVGVTSSLNFVWRAPDRVRLGFAAV